MTELSTLYIDGVFGGLTIGLIAGFVAYSFYMMARMFQNMAS